MTIEQRIGLPLSEFLEQHAQQPFDLINGEIIPHMPTLAGHNYVLQVLYQWLLAALLPDQQARIFSEATFIPPDAYSPTWVTGSFTPDLMIVTEARWQSYIAADPDWRDKPYCLIPDWVIEIVSPHDRHIDIETKIDAYRAAGVTLIWLVNPVHQRIQTYTLTDDDPRIIRDLATTLTGSPVFPACQIQLGAVFT